MRMFSSSLRLRHSLVQNIGPSAAGTILCEGRCVWTTGKRSEGEREK